MKVSKLVLIHKYSHIKVITSITIKHIFTTDDDDRDSDTDNNRDEGNVLGKKR
jgi:hypothetical protein